MRSDFVDLDLARLYRLCAVPAGVGPGVFHRKAHVVSLRGGDRRGRPFGSRWGWPSRALCTLGYENHWAGMGASPDAVDGLPLDGAAAAVKYLTGYVVEKSLSVDNIFVIAMIFSRVCGPGHLPAPRAVLGHLGALAMRGAMIAVGARLIAEFHWILYLFGALLVATGVKMLLIKSQPSDPGQNAIVRLVRRWLPVTTRFHGEHFVVRAGSPASLESEVPGAAPADDPAVAARQARRLDAHPVGPGLDPGGGHRPDLRRRFDPRHFRDHRRPVPCVHQQRVCDPGAAVVVLRPGGHARSCSAI